MWLQRGKGSYRLAHHRCVEVDPSAKMEVRNLIHELLLKETVTREETEGALFRLLLIRALEDGSGVSELTALIRELRETSEPAETATMSGGKGSLLKSFVSRAE